MGERTNEELLKGISEFYRSQIRLLDLIAELQTEIRNLKQRLTDLESKKGCGHCAE